MEFSSAFDFLNRNLLFYALENIGVNDKFLQEMKALYTNTKSAVKINNHLTPWFSTKSGVRQGQNDSSTMFAIFINLLAVHIKSVGVGLQLDNIQVSILLYADDIVLLAETEKDLQKLMNELYFWCTKWRMVVNKEKTNIIHFRPTNVDRTNSEFKYGDSTIDIVSYYKYLGVTFNEFLNKNVPGNVLAEGASRALGKLLSKYYLNKGLGINTYTKIYETCICPIMDYCAGVWGFALNDQLDKIHMRTVF